MTSYRVARCLNIALGAWLYMSAPLWNHTFAQFNNARMVGALVVSVAGLAIVVPLARCVNTVLAMWLFFSAFSLPALDARPMYNSLLVAIAIFTLSLTAPPDDAPQQQRPVS